MHPNDLFIAKTRFIGNHKIRESISIFIVKKTAMPSLPKFYVSIKSK